MKNHTSKNLLKLIQKNFQLFLVGAIIVVVLLGTFIATLLSQQGQDNRNDASVSDGDVVITGRQNPTTFNADGSQGEVILSANTNGVNITGIELHFTIQGSAGYSPVQSVVVQAADATKPSVLGPNSTTDSNGNTVLTYPTADDGTTPVSFAWNISGPGSTFSSTSPVDFAKVKFNVTNPGNISFTFDQVDSMASLPLGENEDEPQDVLSPVATMTFSSVLAENPTGVVDPTATMCAQPTQPLCGSNQTISCVNTPNSAVCQQCNCVDNEENDPTATPTPTTAVNNNATATPSKSPTPTPEGGTGGTTYKYCGESCSAHTDCGVNLMCYGGVCRLANNPTDRYCNSPADNGIHRACNEYCADSRECNSGLTCYYNRCRNPRQVTDQYCADPVTYVPPQTKVVTNTKTITKTVIATATPTVAVDNIDTSTTTTEVTPEWALPTNTLWPTLPPAEVTPEADVEEEVTMVTRIQGWLKGLLILALLMGGVVLVLWLLPILLRKRHTDEMPPEDRRSDDDTPPSRMSGPDQE